MSLLIKGISISLLSLIGAGSAYARPETGGELGPARYGSDYPAGASLAAHHGGNHYEANSSWSNPDDSMPSGQRQSAPSISSGRLDEGRLSPEQRRALRHEIKEVGRELYRQK